MEGMQRARLGGGGCRASALSLGMPPSLPVAVVSHPDAPIIWGLLGTLCQHTVHGVLKQEY